ncbi:hypothetical protein BKP45_14785 [Anaerobacillus alkalidiazotrophicus]|uniref:CopC domain-containing protein n=1 Tax=Anaerobacillus alkalidiazotrophicus TaxID=472963 RepID=A0A1S2M2N8_9BACI|nr:copper resistance protein CopC [Anaerobacillus alkalidiazotrophicus]OIJ18988.1 hypothetical protein BKP45_14785 [Anaerobacillus alkalidiazotrophicus]
MKKQILLIFILFLPIFVFPNHKGAHSYLQSSFPEQGSVIEEGVSELELVFNAGIEKSSIVEIYGSKENSIAIKELIVESPTIYVTLEEALHTDDYEVRWAVIGDDGHPTDGVFHFSILLPVQEEVEDEKVEEVEEAEQLDEVLNGENELREEESKNVIADKQSSNLPFIISLIVIGLAVFLFIYRRKG